MTHPTDRTLVLVHGAASGPWVFDAWPGRWPGYDARIPDLQDGLDVGHASMADYAARVTAAATPGAVVVGWSMGGLVAMLAAAELTPAALVVIEPSPPMQAGRADPDVVVEPGTYDAAEVYGPVSDPSQTRPESALARAERLRGISVPRIACPMLVVAGRDYLDTRGRPVADFYRAHLLEFPDLDHGELVSEPEVCDAVRSWVDRRLGGGPAAGDGELSGR